MVDGEQWTPTAVGVISQVICVILSLSGRAGVHNRNTLWETLIARTSKDLLEKGTQLLC